MTQHPQHPHQNCHKCQNFFKCEELPPCALLITPASHQRIEAFAEWFAMKCREVRPYRQLFIEEDIREQIALLREGDKL